MSRAQLTFVSSPLVPAGGRFALWMPVDPAGPAEDADEPDATGTTQAAPDAVGPDALAAARRDAPGTSESTHERLSDAARRLGFPAGDPGRIATFAVEGGQARAVDLDARYVPILPALRRLAAMPPGSDWPAWSRPSASILAWSVAAKLALELVAAGRLLPDLIPTDRPTQGRARWRIAAPGDPRPSALAAALPAAAHAVRDEAGDPWPAHAAVEAFLDAVADTCGRGGRRPEVDPRRRGPRRPFAEMWVDALAASDPTVDQLRVPVQEVADDLGDWAAPLGGDQRRTLARLAIRIELPEVDTAEGVAGSDAAAPTDDATPTDAAAPTDDAATDVGGTAGSSGAADRGRLATSSAPWRLHFLLQSTASGAEEIDAAEVWARAGRAIELGDRRVEDPAAALTRGLAQAARLFAPMQRALHTAAPAALELDAGEASALLAEGVDALTAGGIAVQVPPELRDADDRQLRLRVRIGQTTVGAPRVAQESPLSLRSLTELRYEVALGDDTISGDELARIVALGQPLVRWRGRWVRVDRDLVDRVTELAGSHASLELTEALAAALSGAHHVEDVGWVETVADGDVGALIARLRDASGPGEARIVGIDGDLRPYQERGVAWLQRLAELGMGGVLADQMGLGKTLQAMALLTSRDQDRPHLVVAPTSVVGNWERELRRFAPEMSVVRHHGPDRAVTSRAFRAGQVIITSYALLRRDVGMLEDVAWDVVVFDEAQQIKNPASKGARAARGLDTRVRIAMTGTPIENRLSELWAIIDLTNPGLLGPARRFQERYAVPVERWHDEGAAARLRRLVAPFVLRRRKDDPEVSVDLPPKQEITVPCALTREQAALYEAAVERAFRGEGLGATAFERRGRILALLTALKQICNHPAQFLRDGGPLPTRSGKLARATEILAELTDGDERALVFTQYREMGELLAQHLRTELDLPEVPFLHGGVALPARDAMVRRFQEDEDAPPILLVSLRAGGTGLNLTRASHVMHFDRWWNPAVEDQATDRVHRIGQTRAVTVHTLVTAGTVEERIAELLERKRALADAVVGTGEAWITELGDAELQELVALSTDDLADDEDDAPARPDPEARPRLVALPGGQGGGA